MGVVAAGVASQRTFELSFYEISLGGLSLLVAYALAKSWRKTGIEQFERHMTNTLSHRD